MSVVLSSLNVGPCVHTFRVKQGHLVSVAAKQSNSYKTTSCSFRPPSVLSVGVHQ